jgi:hypothetical protein
MSAVVICIERDSYIAAIVALEHLLKQVSPEGTMGARLQAAIEDLTRAHAVSLVLDAQIHMPALLRRQAT